MGYCTSFRGHIEIVPVLPGELVDSVNMFRNAKNNTFGDSDAYSFNAIVHHLRGWSKVASAMHKCDASYFDLKQFSVTEVPSSMCHWFPVNQEEDLNIEGYFDENDQMSDIKEVKERKQPFVAIIKWNGEEEFYEYIYWMQYIIDVITLYAKYQFDIEITAFKGSIKWKGKSYETRLEEDCGEIQIEERLLPERTEFYPKEFLPIPPPLPTKRSKNNAL